MMLRSNNISLLKDAVLYIASEDLVDQARDLAALTGALIIPELVPCLTTHVICTRETFELRTSLNNMH